MAKSSKSKPKQGGVLETLKTAVYALAIALFIRTFFVQAFRIPSGSMEDTLLIGDFLLVDKITYGAKVPFTDWRLPGFRDPARGDIIVFKDPRTNRDYIKRCIATGGETIEIDDNVVAIDGHSINEPYKVLKQVGGPVRKDYGPRRLPDGSLFMMGDNRNNSQDSRYWNELDPTRVVGRAFVLYWSTDPERAPRFVREMTDSWAKGLLELVLGRPRITRLGKWLAKDYSEVYALEADASAGAFGAAEAATPTQTP
ncbi:MAG: signal peptidase I [Candidatus Eiseniibacteriota bacterium]